MAELKRSPDACVIVGTLGLLLIALDFNRPGLIVAAAAGLTLLLLSVAGLMGHPLRPGPLAALGLSTVVLLLNVWRAVPLLLLVAASLGLAAALFWLLPPGGAAQVHLPVAAGSGLLLGAVGSALSRFAFRARRAKQVH